MWHKPCRTFHPWCPCIKTRCLSTLGLKLTHGPCFKVCTVPLWTVATFGAVIAGITFYHYRMGIQGTRAPSQYPKRRLSVWFRKVSKPRDLYLELSDRYEIWQAHRQHTFGYWDGAQAANAGVHYLHDQIWNQILQFKVTNIFSSLYMFAWHMVQ